MQPSERERLHPFPCIRSPKGENAGTDGRGTKSPLPIHSFQVNKERMGTEGTDGADMSVSLAWHRPHDKPPAHSFTNF